MELNSLLQLILATVALLLDPTFADDKQRTSEGSRGFHNSETRRENYVGNPAVITQPSHAKPSGQFEERSKSNFVGNPNPWIQNLQEQHKLEQQHLQRLHLKEHNDLLQLQNQQLQYHQMNQPQGNQDFTGSSQNPIVGTAWGIPSLHSPHGGFGGFGGFGGTGTRLFSLGPLGLNSFKIGGLGGGVMPPLLLSTHQQPHMEAGGQSDASTSVVRSRRDVRSENSGNISGRRYGSKTARVQPNGVAQNPTLKSQSDNPPETSKSIKGSEDIVGDREEKNDQDETVGSSLLDPLGLKDKVEDFMEDLGNIPNPLDALRGDGRHPGLPHYLGKADSATKTSQVPQIEEHIVGASQQYNQYPNQYQQQGANDYTLTSQNYPQMNSQQQYQQQPIVGGYRQSQGQQRPIVQPHSTIPQNPAPRPPIPLFGTSPVPQPPFGPAWTGRSNQMAYQRNSMPYQGYAASGYPNSYAQMNGQMTGAKSSMVGAPNPTIQSSNSNGPVNEQQTNGRNMNQPILGSPSPSSGGQEAIIGAPNPTSGFYGGGQDLSPFSDVVGVAQRVIGPLIQDSFTGSGGPYGYQNRNANPMTGLFNGADRYGRYGGYNGGSSPRHLGLGGLYDNGFNNLFDGGYNDWNYHNDRYDRIYGDGYEYGGDYPGYGYGHHHHNHQYSQIFK